MLVLAAHAQPLCRAPTAGERLEHTPGRGSLETAAGRAVAIAVMPVMCLPPGGYLLPSTLPPAVLAAMKSLSRTCCSTRTSPSSSAALLKHGSCIRGQTH